MINFTSFRSFNPPGKAARKPLPGLLCLVLVLGLTSCAAFNECTDPLGCIQYTPADAIHIHIIAPLADQAACPTTTEVIAAIDDAFLKDDPAIGLAYKVIIQESQSDRILAQQAVNQAAEDRQTAAIFELDCLSDNTLIATSAVGAGIPAWIHQYPSGMDPVPGLFSWDRSPADQAAELVSMLSGLQSESIVVLTAPLEQSEQVGQALCAMWTAGGRLCSVQAAQAGLQQPPVLTQAPGLLFVIGPHDTYPADLQAELLSTGWTVVAYDPYFDLPANTDPRLEGMYWIGSQTLSEPSNAASLHAQLAQQAALSLQQALKNVVQYGRNGARLIPRSALLQQLDDGSPFWKCHGSPSCPPVSLSLYKNLGGNLIMIERHAGG